MQTTIDVVLPVFALIFLGWGLARAGVIGAAAATGLSSFVYWVAIPALLFRTMSRTAPPAAEDLAIVAAYFGPSLALYALACLLGRGLFRMALAEQGLFAMGTVFSNTVLLGIPIVFTLWGEAGVLPTLLVITFHSPLLMGLPTIVVEAGLGRREGGGAAAILWSTVKALGRNPIIVALVAGVLYGAAGLGLPKAVDRFTEILGGAAPACALFALGASLAQFRLAGELRVTGVVILLKLVAHPLLVWLAAAWLGVRDDWAAIATLLAALPVGANVYILAERYGVLRAPVTSAILISTGIAVVTVALLIGVIGPPGAAALR